MLHSSCLSALASISSSVTRMIKTSLKHLSQGQNMGWVEEGRREGRES